LIACAAEGNDSERQPSQEAASVATGSGACSGELPVVSTSVASAVAGLPMK
jgi:hypothetical protein